MVTEKEEIFTTTEIAVIILVIISGGFGIINTFDNSSVNIILNLKMSLKDQRFITIYF